MWPDLPAPYAEALRAAVDDVIAHYEPFAIIAAGSVLRGQGGPTSDIDLYVLHHAPFRQRLQRRYASVPFEIFINPPQQVRRYFEEEHAAARPITAHILTTGVIVLDRSDSTLEALRQEAAQWLAKLPSPDADALRWRSYLIADALDNARDLIENDPACASLILHHAVGNLVEYAFLAHGQHLPRQKALLAALDKLDAKAGALARSFYAADARFALEFATQLAQHLTGAVSFFEWDSAQLPV